jgi:hypothetical protein
LIPLVSRFTCSDLCLMFAHCPSAWNAVEPTSTEIRCGWSYSIVISHPGIICNNAFKLIAFLLTAYDIAPRVCDDIVALLHWHILPVMISPPTLTSEYFPLYLTRALPRFILRGLAHLL